ncbi:MAG: hypothetical protein QQN64_08180 [Nitrosopumilus sp.]
MKYKELTMKEEAEWIKIMLVASPEIAENEKRLREAQELVIFGTAMNLGWV